MKTMLDAVEDLFVRGHSMEEIATHLHISVGLVGSYVGARKMSLIKRLRGIECAMKRRHPDRNEGGWRLVYKVGADE